MSSSTTSPHFIQQLASLRPQTEIDISSSSILPPRLKNMRSSTVGPSLKRQRSEASHPTITTSPTTMLVTPAPPTATSSKRARALFFDSIVSNNAGTPSNSPIKRIIAGADDLEKTELLRCFELLHACGCATRPDATLATTRESIEAFFVAIFKDWKSDSPEEQVKPELDVQEKVNVVAGKVCAQTNNHKSLTDCTCKTDLCATGTFTTSPPVFKLEFSERDSPASAPTPVCALTRTDLRWEKMSEWLPKLRKFLEKEAVGSAHRFNKHLAVWQARIMIREWANLEDGKMKGVNLDGQWGFVHSEQVRMALAGLGHEG